MKTISLIIGFLLYFSHTYAQQYIIRYDLAAENVKYYKVKKEGDTSSASVINLSKSNRVILQLVNAANSYQRQIKYIIKEEAQESVIIPGMGNNPLKTLVSGGMPSIDFKNLGMGDIFKKADDDNKSLEIDLETNQQKLLKEQFTLYYNSFNSSISKWESSLQMTQNCTVLWKELAGLRYNLQLPAENVKENARKKTNIVFPSAGDNPNNILLTNATESPKALATVVSKSFSDLQKTYSLFKEYEVKSPVADVLLIDAAEKNDLVNNSPIAKLNSQNDDVVNRIVDLYGQILNDSYTQISPLTVTSKTIMVEISIIPVIDSLTASVANVQMKDTIIRWIPVLKKESLRFRNTVGFSFVSYAENRWHYYVNDDNKIARETADQFQPVVVTYLHFYSPRDKGFRWGGSFGAGIPVGGDNTKLNIMLGLSTFLGKGDPVCITAGIGGTQVKKLSGYSVGDNVTFSELTDKNYSTAYRGGYFLSITFNPSSLNSKD